MTQSPLNPDRRKRWGRWEYVTRGGAAVVATAIIGGAIGWHSCNKEGAVKREGEKIKSDYAASLDSLGITIDSLEGELSERDSALVDTVTYYKGQLGDFSQKSEEEKRRLAEEHKRREAAAMEELSKAREASLDAFLVKSPEFDKNRDYISSIGHWGSKPRSGALDYDDYVTLRRSLEFILEGHPKIVKDVLAGRAVVMSGEVARQKTRDISVRDGEKYIFVADENGNPKGYGMNFDQYEAETGGKQK